MARRYSGKARVYITYQDAHCVYECRLVTPDGARTIWVSETIAKKHAVDSPKAYDEVAHAALSFAMYNNDQCDDDIGIDDNAWMSEDMGGFHVSRVYEVSDA